MNIHIVSGSKGGVGKSFVCMGLLDYLSKKRKVSKDLSTLLIAQLEKAAAEKESPAVILPLCWLGFAMIVLCLMSFVAGAAVSGKGWGTRAIDAIILAPAGWVLPIILLPLCLASAYKAWNEYCYMKTTSKLATLAFFIACAAMTLLSFLLPL